MKKGIIVTEANLANIFGKVKNYLGIGLIFETSIFTKVFCTKRLKEVRNIMNSKKESKITLQPRMYDLRSIIIRVSDDGSKYISLRDSKEKRKFSIHVGDKIFISFEGMYIYRKNDLLKNLERTQTITFVKRLRFFD